MAIGCFRWRRVLLAATTWVIVGGTVLAADQSAFAADPLPTPVMGVIDVPRLMRESSAGRAVAKQRDTYVNAYQADIRKEEKELRDAEQELGRQRSLLSPEAFAEKQNGFRKRFTEFQRTVETKRRNLDRAVGGALSDVEGKIIEITQAVAKERGVNMVLSQTYVYMFEPKFDITQVVLERLNKALPNVTVKDPSKLPPPPSAGAAGGQKASGGSKQQ